MKLIAHRGNINGRIESMENKPKYIDFAISKGYDVEIDVWRKDNLLWLGHDFPEYLIDFEWFTDRIDKLWVHCKNVESIVFFKNSISKIHYFWHENDVLTLTSKGYIWVYPGKQPIDGSIAVMPELNNEDISKSIGVCSDFIEKYKK
jgi:hypothetical protein